MKMLKDVPLFVAALVAATAAVAQPTTHRWTGGTGLFADPNNWDTGTVPATDEDEALFDAEHEGAVTFPAGGVTTNYEATVPTGDYLWDLNGGEYHLVQPGDAGVSDGALTFSTTSADSTLTVTNGLLSTVSFALRRAGNMYLRGGNTAWEQPTTAISRIGTATGLATLHIREGAKAIFGS